MLEPRQIYGGRCSEKREKNSVLADVWSLKPQFLKGAVGVTFIARCNHTDVINLRMPHKLGETQKKTHNDGILWPYTHFFLK
jgi:hypothetical protein